MAAARAAPTYDLPINQIRLRENIVTMNNFSEYLQNKEILDGEEFEKAAHAAKEQKQGLLSYLANNRIISAELLVKAASEFFKLPIVDLSNAQIDEKLEKLFSYDLMREHNVLPIRQNDSCLEIALSDPENSQAIEIIQFQTGLHVKIILARYDHLESFINKITSKQHVHSLNDLEPQADVQDNIELDWHSHDDTPLVQFVNTMIDDAIQKNASDIHFEVYENYCRVRFRLDGVLKETSKIPQNLAQQLAARLKIMAKLDISEHRVPQDGRFKIKLGDQHIVDVRVSSCPVLHGEKIVLRLLDNCSMLRDFREIGFDKKQQNDFLENVNKPQGMIIVTGPTGSGKTVTLYSALKYLNTNAKNISSVEDPVEIVLHGINQVNVNTKAKLTFATALRAFLRQDPDIIMIGEIRDLETAEIAIKAAQTGHLVLSTLHTNSALDALTRLRNMGIAPYNIASSLLLITAQRLARKLCPKCKEEHILSNALRKHFGFYDNVKIFKPRGCEACSNGYSGRIAIHEVLPVDEQFHDLILQEKNNALLRKYVEQQNILSLQQSALEKIARGVTSLDEINRVFGIAYEK